MAAPAGGGGPGRVTRSLAPVPTSAGATTQPGWGLASRSHWSMRACRALGGGVCAWSCSSWATTAAGSVAYAWRASWRAATVVRAWTSRPTHSTQAASSSSMRRHKDLTKQGLHRGIPPDNHFIAGIMGRNRVPTHAVLPLHRHGGSGCPTGRYGMGRPCLRGRCLAPGGQAVCVLRRRAGRCGWRRQPRSPVSRRARPGGQEGGAAAPSSRYGQATTTPIAPAGMARRACSAAVRVRVRCVTGGTIELPSALHRGCQAPQRGATAPAAFLGGDGRARIGLHRCLLSGGQGPGLIRDPRPVQG